MVERPMLLPCHRVSRLDDARLLHEQVPHREVDGVATTFDANAEHIVVHEVAVKDELDGLRTAERPVLTKHVTEFAGGLIEFIRVGLVQQVFESRHRDQS